MIAIAVDKALRSTAIEQPRHGRTAADNIRGDEL